MTRPHVIVYSGVYLDYGGIEHSLLQLLEAFTPRYRFTLLGTASDSFKSQIHALGTVWEDMPLSASFSPQAIRRAYRRFKELKPDLIHTLDPRGSTIGSVAGRLAGIPVVHRHQVSPLDYENNSALKTVFFHLGEAALGWVFISEAIFVGEMVRRRYVRRGLAPFWRSHYIPYSLDRSTMDAIRARRSELRQELGWGENDFVWLNIGRLCPQKAQHIVIEAANLLPTNSPWRVWIAGGGELEETLHAQIQRLGLGERVKLLGAVPQSQSHELMAAADGHIMTSIYENGPIVVLEAMAMRIPSIVTKAGDAWYMSGDPALMPERASLLVSLNDPPALAQQMLYLMQNPPVYAELKAGCVLRSRLFFPERTLGEIEKLFQKVL